MQQAKCSVCGRVVGIDRQGLVNGHGPGDGGALVCLGSRRRPTVDELVPEPVAELPPAAEAPAAGLDVPKL